MPQAKPAPEWLPKAEAAAYLGVSARSLERHEGKGFIEKRVRRAGPLERTNAVEYSVADLEALKRGAPNVHAREIEPDGYNKIVINDAPASNDTGKTTAVAKRDNGALAGAGLAQLVSYFEWLRAQNEPPAVKPWLTLAEAVDYSGLPAAWLVAQARSGGVRAVNVGTGAREFWRFNREGLGKCDEEIFPGEPFLDGAFQRFHRECLIRATMGSAPHQLGDCSCCGGTRSDPPGLTLRLAARLACEVFDLHHVTPPAESETASATPR
jgi:hypothetical protein